MRTPSWCRALQVAGTNHLPLILRVKCNMMLSRDNVLSRESIVVNKWHLDSLEKGQ